jgi:hypothetical protein
MDPHEFVKDYAARSDVPVKSILDSDLMVVACSCGGDGCLGWQMQTEAWVEERRQAGLLDNSTKVYQPKEVYLGETPEEYYAIRYPDMDPEDLVLCLAMDAAQEVGFYTCSCGRRHYVEYVPPPHKYYPRSSICACGHEVVFGE